MAEYVGLIFPTWHPPNVLTQQEIQLLLNQSKLLIWSISQENSVWWAFSMAIMTTVRSSTAPGTQNFNISQWLNLRLCWEFSECLHFSTVFEGSSTYSTCHSMKMPHHIFVEKNVTIYYIFYHQPVPQTVCSQLCSGIQGVFSFLSQNFPCKQSRAHLGGALGQCSIDWQTAQL